jgi:hypothetical protein
MAAQLDNAAVDAVAEEEVPEIPEVSWCLEPRLENEATPVFQEEPQALTFFFSTPFISFMQFEVIEELEKLGINKGKRASFLCSLQLASKTLHLTLLATSCR